MRQFISVCVSVLILSSLSVASNDVQEPEAGIGGAVLEEVVPAEVSPEAEVPAELLATIEAFYDAIETDDIEARVALLADDIVMMPNHWTISRGRVVVAASFRAAEGAVFRIRDRETLAISVSGDMAYTVNSYQYTYHSADDAPQWHKTKNVHIWRLDSAGNWKLTVDIWNSDVPLSDFPGE